MFRNLFSNSKDFGKSLVWFFCTSVGALIFALGVVCVDGLSGAFGMFFVENEKILDIYWNTILILLTVMIPLAIEVIQFLKKLFPKFGSELYLYDVVELSKFYLLLPAFSLSLPLLISPFPESLQRSNEILVFFHALVFFFWMTIFWYLGGVLTKSIALLANSGESVNGLLFKHLSRDKTYVGINIVGEKWEAVWKTYSSLRDEWKGKFLLLFWKEVDTLFQKENFIMVHQLLEGFAHGFLSLNESGTRKEFNLSNEKKRWLWFHDRKFSDGTENPYGVFVRFLELYAVTFKKHREMLNLVSGDTYTTGLDQLNRSVRNVVELIVNDELSTSNDEHYGFFKQLTNHVSKYANSLDKYDEAYLRGLPIYGPVFEHADDYSLQQEHGLPTEWRMSVQNIENLFGLKGDARMRLIWLNHFLDWSSRRIDHGKKGFDEKLEGAFEMLFPNMYNPWVVLAFGYRNLSWGNNRIDSLCQWEQGFYLGSYAGESHWFDPKKSDEENEREWRVLDEIRRDEMKKDTARLIMKLGIFGTVEDVIKLKATLESLEEQYQGSGYKEGNRRELLDFTEYVLHVVD